MLELGGFAENPRVLGGDERDYEAYNYCLAENYYHAFLDEDFEALGDIDSYLVEDIIFWLNYNGKIGKDKENEYKKIRDGSLITCRNRTFIDAICANRNHHMAYTYISMGNHDPRLYTTCLVYGDDDVENVLNLIHSSFEYRTGELYKKFINEIFLLVDQEFVGIREDRRKNVLLHLKESLQVTRVPNNYDVSIDLNTYTWSKELKKLK